MAGRNKLSDEEKKRRADEKAELMQGRTKYNRATNTNQEPIQNTTNMDDQTTNTTNPGQNNTGSDNTTVTTTETTATTDPTTTPAITNEVKQDATPKIEEISPGAQHQPVKGWKPLGGDKIKRDYSTPKIDPNLANTIIPEINIGDQTPGVTANPAEALNKPITDTNPVTGPPKIDPINSDWNTLTEDEKKNAAAQTADMILGVYDKLHYFGREIIKVDDEAVIEAHNDDRIDMYSATVENDEDPEKEVTIQEFWQDFNKQVDERFVVSDNFKAAVRPPMERLCMKYGLGASDGLFLAYKFGEDAATKIAMVVGFKKTVNKMNEMFEKSHSKFKAQVEKEVEARMKKLHPEKTATVNTTTNNADQTETTNTTSTAAEKEKKDGLVEKNLSGDGKNLTDKTTTD